MKTRVPREPARAAPPAAYDRPDPDRAARRPTSPAMPPAPPAAAASAPPLDAARGRRSARPRRREPALPKGADVPEGPRVTVVVCTRNRAASLERALRSLTKLDAAGLAADVLVVDNGSSDDTPAAVERVAAKSPLPVRRAFEPTPGVANARQRGVEEALAGGAEWVAFFDDDQLADRRWLRSLVALADEKRAKFVGGRVTLALPGEHAGRDLAPFTEMLLGASVRMPAARRYDRKTTPGAGNMMVHRDVVAAVGRFDPALDRGEDTDFYMRAVAAGFDAWYTPDAVVDHVIPADRMRDAYLYRLCDVIGNGTAERDRDRFGRAKLPAVWCARLGQAALSLWPKWAAAKAFGSAEAELGRRCRLRVAKRYLADGARYVAGLPVVPPA